MNRLVLATLALSVSSAVSAQVIQAPPRQMQPRQNQSGGVTQDLTLDLNVLGGYDRAPNVLSTAVVPIGGLATPKPGGLNGMFDSSLAYGRSSGKRSLDASARGYVNSYQNAGTGALLGGEQTFGVGLKGRRNSLQLTQGYQDAPYYSLGVLGPLGGVGGNPTLAYTNGRSWTLSGGANWDHQWGRSTSMNTHYAYGRFGSASTALVGQFINENHTVGVDVNRSVGRRMTVRSKVSRSVTRNLQGTSYQATIHDSVDGGVSYSRVLSATKALTLSGRVGAANTHAHALVNGNPYQFWTPIVSASAAVDMGRSWSVNSDYTRNVVVPSTLSATQTAYVSHLVTGGVGGELTESIKLALSTSMSTGQTGQGAIAGGSTLPASAATYRAYTFTGQVSFQLSETVSAMLNAGHVETRMNALASQAFGVVPNMRRTQVRAGLSWTLPLIGRSRRRT